jgi:hypothetical protein
MSGTPGIGSVGYSGALIYSSSSSTAPSSTASRYPGVTSVGNFTAAPDTQFTLSGLFQGIASQSSAISQYTVIIQNNNNSVSLTGRLLLNGVVTTTTTFTPAQFAQLTYVAGTVGSTDRITVNVTAGGVRGSPVQLVSTVTGSNSANALSAIKTTAPSASVVNQSVSSPTAPASTGQPITSLPGQPTVSSNPQASVLALFPTQAQLASQTQQSTAATPIVKLFQNAVVTPPQPSSSKAAATAATPGAVTYSIGAAGASRVGVGGSAVSIQTAPSNPVAPSLFDQLYQSAKGSSVPSSASTRTAYASSATSLTASIFNQNLPSYSSTSLIPSLRDLLLAQSSGNAQSSGTGLNYSLQRFGVQAYLKAQTVYQF